MTRGKTFTLTAVLSLLVLAFSPAYASDFAVGSKLEDFKLTGIDGKEHSFSGLMGKNGAVLVFLSAQCPVVKAYNERINQIAADYESKGIKFIGINSNATEDLAWVTRDAAEVGYKFPVLIDKGNVLADKLGATVTPEVYFFDAKSTLCLLYTSPSPRDS
ncbi:MAG: redoxin domain-containing protein, partial [Pyrinomonadaceae bacterium]|nr:redoxin domain-containing protein [Pyrinomonadaceae bacterium]